MTSNLELDLIRIPQKTQLPVGVTRSGITQARMPPGWVNDHDAPSQALRSGAGNRRRCGVPASDRELVVLSLTRKLSHGAGVSEPRHVHLYAAASAASGPAWLSKVITSKPTYIVFQSQPLTENN